jgi:hypothetical protein
MVVTYGCGSQAMLTEDVRLDTTLNKQVWSQGVRNVPKRLRIRLERKRNEDEEAVNKFYTLVSHVPVDTFKGMYFSLSERQTDRHREAERQRDRHQNAEWK